MSGFQGRNPLRQWIFFTITSCLIVYISVFIFVARDVNELNIMESSDHFSLAIKERGLRIDSSLNSISLVIESADVEPNSDELKTFMSTQLSEIDSGFTYFSTGDIAVSGRINKEGYIDDQLPTQMNKVLGSIDEGSLIDEKGFLYLDDEKYFFSSLKQTSSNGKVVTVIMGEEIKSVLSKIKHRHSVKLDSKPHQLPLTFSKNIEYKIFKSTGSEHAYYYNTSTFSPILLSAFFKITALGAFLSIALLSLYKSYFNVKYRQPVRNLRNLIKSRYDFSPIECPSNYDSLAPLVGEINKAFCFADSSVSRMRNVINNIRFPISIIDSNSNIVFSNKAFSNLKFASDNITLPKLKEMHSAPSEITALYGEVVLIEDDNGREQYFKLLESSTIFNGEECTLIELQNISEIVCLRDRLHSRFTTDELTSLHTRYHFNEIADKLISENKDTQQHIALVDINEFKILNDSAGHDIGDLILMELSNIIRTHTDDDDLVGRISGDEFVIFFNNKSIEIVEQTLSLLHSAIKSYRIEHYDTQIGVSVSIGVVTIPDQNKPSIQTLLQQADLAVMTAKKSGLIFKKYNALDVDIAFYKEAPVWINRIKQSIANDTLELFVQEITPLDNKNPLHVEVLLRMKNEEGGFFSPNSFFSIAEKFNLTTEIDEWVVVNTFKKFIDGTFNDCKVSINLSGETIKNRQLIDKIICYADFYKIDPSLIVFEITETMAIDDINAAISNINSLRIKGFSIALDDFGSGFSTFKYLQNIPADYIKIDGIFVKNSVRSERDRAIISNIVSIGHELNMKCVAEFVEDQETSKLMDELGVDYVQGYCIHKPEPAKDWSSRNKELTKAS